MANFPSHAGRNGAQGWRADPTPSPGHDSTWQALPRRPRRRRARVCVCVHTPVFPRLQPAAPLIPPGPTQSTHTEAHRWLATPQQHWAQPRDQADGAVGGPSAKPSRQAPSEPSPRRPRKCPSTPEAPRRDERNSGQARVLSLASRRSALLQQARLPLINYYFLVSNRLTAC